MFWGEFGLGIVLPLVLFGLPRVRRTDSGLVLAATLTIMGFIVNRLNVAITGMTASSGVTYVPSWMELAVTISIVAAGFALFGLAVRHLSVFPERSSEEDDALRDSSRAAVAGPPVHARRVLATLWSLLLVGAVAVAYTAGHQTGDGTVEADPVLQATQSQARPGPLTHLPDPYRFAGSQDSPGEVVFSHESHVDRDAPRCGACHAAKFLINTPGTPYRGELSYERIHEGDLCASCHDGQKTFGVDEDCSFCHR
jgi:c(7)-type cytochrome triheme protein